MKNGKHGGRSRFDGSRSGGNREEGRPSGPSTGKRFDKSRADKPGFGKPPGGKPGFGKPRSDKPRPEKPNRFEKSARFENAEREPERAERPTRFGTSRKEGPRFEKPRFDRPDGDQHGSRPERGPRGPRRDRNLRTGPFPGERPGEGGGRVWLYGIHPVLAALANPRRKILRIAVQREVDAQLGPKLETLAEAHPIGLPDAEILDREQLDRMMPRGAVHQGLAALVDGLDDPDLDDIIRATEGQDAARVVVLDQVTDPHNVGAILRSCAGFGVAAVICPERHSPGATAVMAKAASGALERVPFVRVVNLARALEHLKKAGYWCVGLAGEASTEIHQADMTGKIALVVGAEGEGLRRLTREHCDLLVRIPIDKGLESLNVSNATAIALYELQRRVATAL
ncbi:MAG: 23S rRNA (guanosine(2251)-2'-O)-methyltransferase RlmB [Tagaea sp. CACIAM 22H2]|nr:23S rRNA (guanosine(2251)-2'-O)-methyltransferase RlmB [Tagaea sp. CACIAM 22H2]